MTNKHVVCLNEKEILDILNCDFVSYGYNRNSKNNSGYIDTYVEYFYKRDGHIKITVNEAKDIIYNYLKANKMIDNTFSKFLSKISLTHSWGCEDKEGYCPSIWRTTYEISTW